MVLNNSRYTFVPVFFSSYYLKHESFTSGGDRQIVPVLASSGFVRPVTRGLLDREKAKWRFHDVHNIERSSSVNH